MNYSSDHASETVSPQFEFESIEIKPLHDQVYGRVRDAIMAGQFSPGQTLSMQAIAAAFGTSTMPVREALRRLAAEGAVEIRPKRAVRIPHPPRSRVLEIAELRVAVEGLAASRAAERITDGELSHLKEIDAAAEAALRADHLVEYLALNQQFYFAIYRAGEMEVGMAFIESLWLRMGPLQRLYTSEGLEIGATKHREIIAALRDRDGESARDAMAADIRIGVEILLDRALSLSETKS